MSTTTDPKSEPEIHIQPDRGPYLVDDKLHISISGLPGSQNVTLHTVIREGQTSIESCCCFTADSDGTVDLYSHPCLSGSYTGVSPMGIFWSMEPSPAMRKGFRLMKKDMTTPLVADLAVYLGHGHLNADDAREPDREPVRRHVIERWYQAPGVTSHEVTEGRVRGKLFLPLGPGPFPGVIDLFGTAGGLLEYRAALLASRGVASLALPYFRYRDLPENPEDVDLDYFIEAVKWLSSHSAIKGPNIGMLAVSRGADIGYILAAHCPEIVAFVSINGCTFNPGWPIKFSGGDVPAVPVNYGDIKTVDGALYARDMFTYTENDLTPVWRHNPHVLNIVCEDDAFIPIECVYLLRNRYPRDRVNRFQIQAYPGAGHLLEPPYMPLTRVSWHKTFGTYFLYGGQPEPHAQAQEDAWRRVLVFFREHLPTSGDPAKL